MSRRRMRAPEGRAPAVSTSVLGPAACRVVPPSRQWFMCGWGKPTLSCSYIASDTATTVVTGAAILPPHQPASVRIVQGYRKAWVTQEPFIWDRGPSLIVAVIAAPSNSTKTESSTNSRQLITRTPQTEHLTFINCSRLPRSGLPMPSGCVGSYGTIRFGCSSQRTAMSGFVDFADVKGALINRAGSRLTWIENARTYAAAHPAGCAAPEAQGHRHYPE